jgi:alpha/beta superfamily hydrolase
MFLGHKNYLFQEKLAKELSFDNFRFDFRGNGESDGILKFSNFQVCTVEKNLFFLIFFN